MKIVYFKSIKNQSIGRFKSGVSSTDYC